MADWVKLGLSYVLPIPVDDGKLPPDTPTPLDPATLTVTGTSLTTGVQAFIRSLAQITRNGTGDYELTITTGAGAMLPAIDTYTITITTTNPPSGDSTWLDVVPNTPGLVSLTQAKRQLGRDLEKRRSDEPLLAVYVDAVNDWVRQKCGPVLPELVVETVTPSVTGAVRLRSAPVLSVVSATYNGTTVSTSTWSAPDEWGRLTVPAGLYAAPVPPAAGLVVTYRAGRSPIPRPIPVAAWHLLDHLWEIRRTTRPSTGAPAGAFDDVITVGGIGYAVPNRVTELLADYAVDLPGVA